MRVLFVLPAPVRIPMGGAAVVYRHAEGLAARGHEVTVAAPRRGEGLRGLLLRAAVRVRDHVHGVGSEPLFQGEGVRTLEVSSPTRLEALASEAVIATGFQTAPWVHRLTAGTQNVPFYFLQHDERHLNPSAEATWHLPFTRVAVAQWIAEVVEAHGAPVAAVVPNAVAPLDFGLDRPLEQREGRVIALYHRLPVKGPETLIEALDHLRALVPHVRADVIAARPPSHRFPVWVDLHVRPEQDVLRRLYNRAAVCLHTSRLEGWGLVPMEAAACGCAVVATESRGVAEFLHDGRSMVQVPVGDAVAVAERTARLLQNSQERVALAQAAVADVGRFSWEASTDRLEAVLQQAVSG